MSKKFTEKLTNIFSKSNNNKLVTDAAPLENDDQSVSETTNRANSSLEQRNDQTTPSFSWLPLSESGQLQRYDTSNSTLMQQNNSMVEHQNSLSVNSTQQNVYQFSNISGLHIGSVFNYNLNQKPKQSGDKTSDRQSCSTKKTRSIDAMMKSTESINHKVMDVISTHLGTNWRMIIRYLGFSDGQIDQMMEDHYIKGVKEVIYRFLLDYSRNNDNASLGHITTLLWRNDFKDVVVILKEHWKNGELGYSNESTDCQTNETSKP